MLNVRQFLPTAESAEGSRSPQQFSSTSPAPLSLVSSSSSISGGYGLVNQSRFGSTTPCSNLRGLSTQECLQQCGKQPGMDGAPRRGSRALLTAFSNVVTSCPWTASGIMPAAASRHALRAKYSTFRLATRMKGLGILSSWERTPPCLWTPFSSAGPLLFTQS